MKTKITLSVLLTVLAMPVFSQTPPPAPRSAAATPSVDQRQLNQQQRIDQGVQSGALTGKEAARLEKGQEHVQRMEDKAKADGTVTRQERKRLQHAENVQSRKIERQKHDRQHDYNHDGKKDRPRRRH
ncbi:MAG: hypothetical protein EG825_04965 [Rhodocyclaceae bacterium]|nr:hypothetical protein [Rhodocyclaceae bacterium]